MQTSMLRLQRLLSWEKACHTSNEVAPRNRPDVRALAIAPPRTTDYNTDALRQEREDGGPAWTLQEYQKLYRNYRAEEDYEITDIEGRIPADVEGTFYRNGPGILELGGHKMHAFDGHGLIAKIAIKNGQATFRSRYIQTEAYKTEMAAEKIMYRGFGTQKPGGILTNFMDTRGKRVGNTSVMEWNGKLFALWEGDNPTLMDPTTLETIGPENFDGLLDPWQPFTAHPCYDNERERLVAFSNDLRRSEGGKLRVWELDRHGKVVQSTCHKFGLLPIMYLHDFQITRNWYIFHQAPFKLLTSNVIRYLAGLSESTQQIGFDHTVPGKWILCPRDGGEPQIVETEPMMIWHYGNAFEDESGKITVDACTMKAFDFSTFDMRIPSTIPGGEVVRHTVDPKAKSSTARTIMPGLGAGDFPQTNPKNKMDPNYRYLYIAGTAHEEETFPFRRVVKLNMQTGTRDSWLAPPGCFVSEPIYIPRKGVKKGAAEDDGYVTCLISDGRRDVSRLAFFEARRISEGPICQLQLSKLIPMAFHCCWSQTAFV